MGFADPGPKDIRPAAVVSRATGAGRLKDELLQTLWPGTFVEEGTSVQQIFLLRKILGRDEPQYISTVPRRGYRFVAEVQERSEFALFLRGPSPAMRSPQALGPLISAC